LAPAVQQEHRVPYAEINGQRLFFEDTGGEGPPVVFSHGFLMDHEMFAPQVAELRDVFRVITWDARGFGQTESDGTPFSYWDSARDVFALLDLLGIERAVLAGMSQGGYLSLRAALLQPDRVRALILIDTQAPTETTDKIAEYRAMIEVFAEQGYVEEVASGVAEAILGDPVLAERWKAKWRRWDSRRLRPAATALLEREDISERLDELAMPVLCVHGTLDAAIPVSRSYEICAAVSDCRGVIEVPGAPHASSLTHPEVVNPPLRAFLEGLPA
jgi:3-oxoadipate enol-lactonase